MQHGKVKPYTKADPRLGSGLRQATEALVLLNGSSEHPSQEKALQAVQQDEGIYKERDKKFLLVIWEGVGLIWGTRKGVIKTFAFNISEARTL